MSIGTIDLEAKCWKIVWWLIKEIMNKLRMHTFVVCAYGESPYLGDCIRSLLAQTVESKIIISTSTPNRYIESIADQYEVELAINAGNPGIAHDWNCAMSYCGSGFVTIAHQDDVYEPEYTESALMHLFSATDPLIYFCDYGEIRENEKKKKSGLLDIKRLMLSPYRLKGFSSFRFVKRLPLSLGNPICCPSVTYVVDNLALPLFREGFRSNLDWDAWERFSRLDGSFVYDPHVRMYHRVHDGSETSACIADNARTLEDLEMLKRFWPKPIAKMINRVYSGAQRFN